MLSSSVADTGRELCHIYLARQADDEHVHLVAFSLVGRMISRRGRPRWKWRGHSGWCEQQPVASRPKATVSSQSRANEGPRTRCMWHVVVTTGRSTSRPGFQIFRTLISTPPCDPAPRGWQTWHVAVPRSHPGPFSISCRHVPAQAFLKPNLCFPHPLIHLHFRTTITTFRAVNMPALLPRYYEDYYDDEYAYVSPPHSPALVGLLPTGSFTLYFGLASPTSVIYDRVLTTTPASLSLSHSSIVTSQTIVHPVHQINPQWLLGVTIAMDTAIAIATAHGIPGSAGSSSRSSSSVSSSSSSCAGKHPQITFF